MGAWPDSGFSGVPCEHTMRIEEFDLLSPAQASALLHACCGSRRWVREMVARRPFGSRDRLVREAAAAWRSLGPADWQEAFAHHPRIGERQGARSQSGLGERWSAGEQAGANPAEGTVRQQLERINREYEDRFGYIYIVCASGRTAEDLLQAARARLAHDPAEELEIAAEEQLKITLLRLDKLLSTGA
jgi:2-oxo-4-hydroxy-4-carboxy-5-ureidoimidazoline decarboxylase